MLHLQQFVAIALFACAVVAFVIGYGKEWRQSQPTGLYPLADTRWWAAGAAICFSFGLSLVAPVPMLVTLVASFCSVLVFGWFISRAGKRSDSSDTL